MTTKLRRLAPLALIVAMAAFTPTGEASRRAGQTDQQVTVTVGEGTAAPDAPVTLALSLSAPDTLPIGSVTVRIAFPKALLSFVNIDSSGLALAVNADVRAEVKKGPNEATSVVEATISTIGKGGSRQAIPVGLIAYLSFKIDNRAEVETTIALTHEATATTTGDQPGPVIGVVASKAEVNVSSPPVAACFFYMH